jgi:hypothetical protein
VGAGAVPTISPGYIKIVIRNMSQKEIQRNTNVSHDDWQKRGLGLAKNNNFPPFFATQTNQKCK